jgi:DNA-binding CsgD family transcriptional regulator
MAQTYAPVVMRPAQQQQQPGAFDPLSSPLLDALQQRADEVAELVAQAARGNPRVPYDEPAAHTIQHVREHVQLLAQVARSGQSPTAAQLEFARREFVRKVDTASVGALLQGYRVGYRAMCGWIADEARAHAHDVQDIMSLMGRTFDYLELVRNSVADAYLNECERLGLPAIRVPIICARRTDAPRVTWFEKLSPRERDLVVLVARGLTNKEIAVHLQISLQTTKEYMSRVLDKTGLPSRTAVAASYALTSAIAHTVPRQSRD